jgi:hypothetical protein
LKSKISDIKAAQREFEETTTDTIGKQFKSVMTMIKQQAQNLHEEFGSKFQVTRSIVEGTRFDV